MFAIPMLNQQQPEKPQYRCGDELDVVDIFYTLQGEGPFAGTPAVFIRLAGCNLQCGGCDTDYTSNRGKMSITQILQEVCYSCSDDGNNFGTPLYPRELSGIAHGQAGASYPTLVVITGGEPFRQSIGLLITMLHMNGYHVQIETNGTLCDDDIVYGLTNPWPCTVVCSPKTPRLAKSLLPHISALKYVLDADHVDLDGLPTSTLGSVGTVARPWVGFAGKIYVSPADAKTEYDNKRNIDAAVKSCMTYGYTLSLQMHKVVQLP